jgi:hypothetical protein
MGEIAKISKFLGLNEDIDTQLQPGEASAMQNYRVTHNFKLRQVDGYRKLFASVAARPVRGQWYGKIGATYFHLVACNGHLYKVVAGTPTDLGVLADADTFMFHNDGKVYIMDGTNYKSFDGTTLADVAGYVPTVMTSTGPLGDGTELEDINLLTGQKIQKFNPDGAAATYYLMEQDIDSVDSVVLSGSTLTVTTDYTVDLAAGTISPVTPADWPVGENTLVVTWTKASTANREEVTKCRKAMQFGTRIHIWGHPTYKNRRWYGGVVNAITSAEYFPSMNVANIGPDEFGITDIVSQYDRQIIFTDGGRAYYSHYQSVDYVIAFPVFDLNETIGNLPFGQCQVIDNFPVSIQDKVYRWASTGVQDERNAVSISQRVQATLDTFTRTTIKTLDWERKREYWIVSGNTALVHNYQTDVWYKFVFNDKIESMVIIDNALYFGTDNGEVMYFVDGERTFNEVAIEAEWEMGYFDWGAEFKRKFISRIWVTVEAAVKTNLDVSWLSDRSERETASIEPIVLTLFDYDNINYGAWSYKTTLSPTPYRIKTKSRKFSFLKYILRNDRLGYTSSVMSISMDANVGGNIR